MISATVGLMGETCSAEESGPDRRQRLSKMSATEKEELRQEQGRFKRLPEAEQSRLRKLDGQLEAAPDGEQLRKVMLRYTAWLRTLNSSQRTALLRLPMDKRVAEIRALVEQRDRQRFEEMFDYHLQPSDQKVLLTWSGQLIERNEPRMLEPLPVAERHRLHQMKEKTRRYAMLAILYRQRFGDDLQLFERLQPTEADLENLASDLSARAREILDEPRDRIEREKLLQNWVTAALESRIRPEVAPEQLRRFLSEELTDEERQDLESWPRERMRFEVRRLYWKNQMREQTSRPGGKSTRGLKAPRPPRG